MSGGVSCCGGRGGRVERRVVVVDAVECVAEGEAAADSPVLSVAVAQQILSHRQRTHAVCLVLTIYEVWEGREFVRGVGGSEGKVECRVAANAPQHPTTRRSVDPTHLAPHQQQAHTLPTHVLHR